MGVDAAADKDEGAGDQGIMFGFACDETPELMPAPITYAHQILQLMAEARHAGQTPELGPDAKSQVTLRYAGGRPVACTSLVVSTQHRPAASREQVREIVRGFARKVLPEGWLPPEQEFYVNPTGQFIIGGPDGDAGLTGRKIIVDTYGGLGSHGGGCFSGKDPTKVDRSGSYAARHVAKNLVAAGLAKRCEIEIAYAIGVPEPISVMVDTMGTGEVPDSELVALVKKVFDLRPNAIIDRLDLRRPIYLATASYGHFGREEPDFTWERTDMVEELKKG
jgi:S-adenosylmethionine synthetase